MSTSTKCSSSDRSPFSIEVLGGLEKKVKGKVKTIKEYWYARVVRFQGDHTVPDEDTLNVESYGAESIAVTVTWFHQAKEVRRYLSSQPKSESVGHLIAALSDDQHLAGTAEDTIEWQTINRSGLRMLHDDEN